MPTSDHHRSHLVRNLAGDWTHLVRSHPNLDLAATLRATGYRDHPGANPAPTADDGCSDPDAADARLAELVRSAAHDTLAARVVLQRLLPGIVAIARRRGGDVGWGPVVHVYDDLVANAWIVIRCYPIERRPVHVAANLLRDIEYQTFTRPARLRRVATEHIDPTRPGHEPADRRNDDGGRHAFEELVAVLASARDAGIDEDSLRFAARIASGQTLAELAADDGISERAERYRRTTLVRRLQQLVLAGDTDDDLEATSAHTP